MRGDYVIDAMQRQIAVAAYLKSKQLLLFAFAFADTVCDLSKVHTWLMTPTAYSQSYN